MSDKLHRKIRQLYARDVKRMATKELQILPHILKPRQWWMPKFVWKVGIAVFINRKELEEAIKKK